MNPLTYETKRAHWKATWYGIRLFSYCAEEWKEPLLEIMTPARFDVLYAAWSYKGHERSAAEDRGFAPHRRIPMMELRKLLGLAASTISRISHRLEELQLVCVVRDDPQDRRRVSVVLTEEGIMALELAIQCITMETNGFRTHIENFVATRASDGLSKEGTAEQIRQHILRRLGTIIDRARAFARFFGSSAVPIYDTRVCDQVPYPTLVDDEM